MKLPKLTTTVYKYNRLAPWLILLYLVLTISFFVFSKKLPQEVTLIAVAFFVAIPIFAGIRSKSIFSLRSVDDRRLTLNPDQIVWGNRVVPINEVDNLNIYIFAFDSFTHLAGLGGRKTEHGDRNKLEFNYKNTKYDLTFYLGTFEDYDTLVQIIETWRAAGIKLSAKTAFEDAYIRQQFNS
jgi:hypothetical protein